MTELPGRPGRLPARYQPTWVGSVGVARSPSGVTPTASMGASTPIDWMRRRARLDAGAVDGSGSGSGDGVGEAEVTGTRWPWGCAGVWVTPSATSTRQSAATAPARTSLGFGPIET